MDASVIPVLCPCFREVQLRYIARGRTSVLTVWLQGARALF